MAPRKQGGKKRNRRVIDPFSRKEWYNIKAPSTFAVNHVGYTLASKSQGTKLASDSLKGRVYEINMAELSKDDDLAFRKVKLLCEDVRGNDCYTDFHGMDMTRDKVCSLIKKGYSLIEANCDVKTQDGYIVRMFALAFTARRNKQVKSTCYAQAAHVRLIRKKMIERMTQEASALELQTLVANLTREKPGKNGQGIAKQISEDCKNIFPLQNVFIRKVKTIVKPKLDIVKLMALHAKSVGDSRAVIAQSDAAQNLLTAEAE